MHRILLFPRFKYPKLLLLVLTYVIAYLLFADRELAGIEGVFSALGYVGVFLAGIMYSYGFTAAPAAAFFAIISGQVSIIPAGLIGGLGSLIGDLSIFEFIRTGFEDELRKLHQEHLLKRVNVPFKTLILPFVVGFFIASPLPDEIGVSLLAASKISARWFAILSYLLNTAGIFAFLLIGK